MADTDLVGQYKKNVSQMPADSISSNDYLFFKGLPMAKLIKVARMVGAMHEEDHAYSIRSTW